MGAKIAKAVSALFAPQISPIYFFAALFFANKNSSFIVLWLAIIFSSLIPLLSLFALAGKSIKFGTFLETRSRRAPLFYSAIASYLFGFISLKYFNAPFIVSALMFAYLSNSVLAAVLNKYANKVSIHVWGISGPSIAILYAFGILAFFLSLSVAMLVGLCRIAIKSHTLAEVETAIAASILFTYMLIFLMPTIFPALV